MAALKYAIVTPARNEADFIEQTIQAMIAQTLPPLRWVIVSDGSTDSTDEIVKRYIQRYPWIDLVRMPVHRDRQFAAKVQAFNAGYARLNNTSYDIVGNLDADITFEESYFEFLMEKFSEDDNLGVAGTPFVEDGSHYDYKFTNISHVSGACQMFRRECFSEIGGYIPIKGGGIDWTAVTTARMKGWTTRTFTDMVCYHHRKIGTGDTNLFGAWFRHGRKDYFLGGHPIWQLFRSIYQMRHRPYLIGGSLLLLGYIWAAMNKIDRPISIELMKFHRKEQVQRLKSAFKR